MKFFEEPVLEVEKINVIDVITTSPTDPGPDNWDTPDL